MAVYGEMSALRIVHGAGRVYESVYSPGEAREWLDSNDVFGRLHGRRKIPKRVRIQCVCNPLRHYFSRVRHQRKSPSDSPQVGLSLGFPVGSGICDDRRH